MSEATEGVELAVPDESGERLTDLVYALEQGRVTDRTPDRWVRTIAAPVVAAELRRLAAQIEPDEPFAASLIRDRADELDGGT